jgi:Putative beta-barrel porin-2, OmpL-like. bbp2
MSNPIHVYACAAALCLAFVASPVRAAESAGAKSAAQPMPEASAAAKPNAAPAPSPDPAARVDELEKMVHQLQDELADMKKQLSASPASVSAGKPAEAPAAPAAASGPLPAKPQSGSNSAPVPAAAAAPTAPGSSPFDSISISGMVDGYYGYNFQHPHGTAASVPAGNSGTELTPYRAFDAPTNALSLNMIELTLAKAPDANNSRLGFNLTLGYGNAMNVVNSTDPAGLGFAQYLKEGYVSWLAPVGKGLQIDFGKFVTQHGAEVIETSGNWNYSRGILFTYAIPFYHFGLRSKYVFNDKYNFSAYLVNGWNDIQDNNSGKTGGFQFGWNPTKKIGVIQNYMVGPEQANDNSDIRHLWDTIVTYNPTSNLSLMWNFDYGRDTPLGTTSPVWWSGIAAYARYAFNEKYAFAGRYEFYDDHNGFTTGGTPQDLNEFTLTFERTVSKHLITRWEFRRDMSNQPTMLKGGTPVTAQNTALGGLVYLFDIHEGH